MKWSVYRLDNKGRGARGSTLGTVEAPTKLAAVQLALDRFRNVGLTIRNADIVEYVPEY